MKTNMNNILPTSFDETSQIRNLTLSILWRSRRPPIVDTPSDAGGRSDRLIPTVQVMCQYAAIGITQYATRVFVAIDGQ